MLSLPPRKQLKMVQRYAVCEFHHRSAERGRTLLEGIVSNNPKRLDVWFVWLDQETRLGDTPTIRALYERVITLNLSSKKMVRGNPVLTCCFAVFCALTAHR